MVKYLRVISRTPRPVVDSAGRIFMVLAGRPDYPSYVAAADTAADLLYHESRKADFSVSEAHHRRGNFPALATGVSYGQGQTMPTNLVHETHASLLSRLVGNDAMQRMASFADGGPLFFFLINHR